MAAKINTTKKISGMGSRSKPAAPTVYSGGQPISSLAGGGKGGPTGTGSGFQNARGLAKKGSKY